MEAGCRVRGREGGYETYFQTGALSHNNAEGKQWKIGLVHSRREDDKGEEDAKKEEEEEEEKRRRRDFEGKSRGFEPQRTSAHTFGAGFRQEWSGRECRSCTVHTFAPHTLSALESVATSPPLKLLLVRRLYRRTAAGSGTWCVPPAISACHRELQVRRGGGGKV